MSFGSGRKQGRAMRYIYTRCTIIHSCIRSRARIKYDIRKTTSSPPPPSWYSVTIVRPNAFTVKTRYFFLKSAENTAFRVVSQDRKRVLIKYIRERNIIRCDTRSSIINTHTLLTYTLIRENCITRPRRQVTAFTPIVLNKRNYVYMIL